MILFLSTVFIQLGETNQAIDENTITVDDEPGDADYTSIKEAINNSKSGDIIEVYSGTYEEDDINIFISNLTLKGIPNELGEGNDTGKPLINATGLKDVFLIHVNDVTITGFEIETSSNSAIVIYSEGNVINENTIKTVEGVCILINGTVSDSKKNGVIFNSFINENFTTAYGVFLNKTNSNVIMYNNFLVKTDAYFINSFKTIWLFNYWQNPRILPKPISGKLIFFKEIFPITIPWLNIDWRPALEPFNFT
jgi:hypothetical protein